MNNRNLRQVFADKFTNLAKKNKKLVVVVGDISHGIFSQFRKRFPKRYYNIGIHEQSMMSVGAGLSKSGLIPVIHTIASFLLERSYEQIKLDFGYQNLSGNLVSVGSAFDYAALGCTHHCYTDFMLLKTLPNSEIFYPGSSDELEKQIQYSYNNNKITLFRITSHQHKIKFDYNKKNYKKIINIKKGNKLTLICTAPFVIPITKIIKEYKYKNKIDLLYVNCIKPLDIKTLKKSIIKTKNILLIEDHIESGGIYEDVIKLACKEKIHKFNSINIPKTFIRSYGEYKDIIKSISMDKSSIKRSIDKSLKDF